MGMLGFAACVHALVGSACMFRCSAVHC
jgi:hypothetical protein